MSPDIKISFFILFAIVFGAGILSGVLNYTMFNYAKKWQKSEFVNCILYGIFFSAMVMFFLQLFITTFSGKPQDMKLIHVVFGFTCFIGSIFLYLILQMLVKRIGQEQSQ